MKRPKTNTSAQDISPAPLTAELSKVFRQKMNDGGLLWLGKKLDVRLMSVESGKAAGVCVIPDSDRFILVESGSMLLLAGNNKRHLNIYERAKKGCAVMIPAGMWHDIICLSRSALRLCIVSSAENKPQTAPKKEEMTKIDHSGYNTAD